MLIKDTDYISETIFPSFKKSCYGFSNDAGVVHMVVKFGISSCRDCSSLSAMADAVGRPQAATSRDSTESWARSTGSVGSDWSVLGPPN